MRRILFVLGTRPEAIKLAPVVSRFREARNEFETKVVVTAQHRGLLDQALSAFSIVPDHDLNVMRPGQTLSGATSSILAALEPVLAQEKPDLVMVQGDTTTTLCGALAAFYQRLPVGHVEAGLRTYDLGQPFPEELNRSFTARLSALHFPPTEAAAENLRREGIDEGRICVTGNTGIDAVLEVREALDCGRLRAELPELDENKRLILVTAHRRESFGEGFQGICEAIRRIAARADAEVIYPVHPNPNVRAAVDKYLSNSPVRLIEPMSYVPFVALMDRAHILLTDSGGIQEEGPSLGKPVLVMREKTERPEAVEAGTARLVGTDPGRISAEVNLLLDDPAEYERRSRIHNPYGDGHASDRIVAFVRAFFGMS